MPNYFQLSRKSDPENKPVRFVEVDEEICRFFNQEPDPVKYVAGWYDSIGVRLAMGMSLSGIKQEFEQEINKQGMESIYLALFKICEYLEENYNSNAWARIGNPR
jgi:hypothetical protein